MIIVIDGPDGSGKTTISRKLESILKNAGVKTEYKKYELRLENLVLSRSVYNLIKFFIKINREKYREKYGKVLMGEKSGSFKDKIISNFIILDKALTAILMKFKYRKDILILDAYIYDNLVPFYCRGLVSKIIYNLILSLKPFIRGDVEIILDGSTEKLFERREGVDYDSVDFVNCNRRYFKDIAKKMKSPVVYVDSPIDETINKVLNAFLKQLPGYNQEEHLLHILSDPFFRDKPKEIRNEIINIFDLEKIRWGKVLNIAEKQKILLPLLQNLMILPIKKDLKRVFEYKLNEVLELRNKRLRLIKEVVSIFNVNNINYAIFKSIPSFPSELDSDLDVLIDTSDVPKAINVLKKDLWIQTYLTSKRKVGRIFLFLYPSIGLYKDGFEVDFHDSITWGSFIVLTSEIKNILKYKKENIIESIKTYTLPDEYEFIFVIAHALCKHSRINLWDIHFIRGLLRKDMDFKKVYDVSKKHKILHLVNYFLNTYKVKNIFYWEKNLSKSDNSMLYGLSANYYEDWRKFVVSSEIHLSILKQILSNVNDLYNFYKEMIPALKQPKWLYNIYRNKLRAEQNGYE